MRVWAVAASELTAPISMHRTLNARGVTPAGAGPAPVQAAEEMERLAELLLNAAAREQVLRRLGEAVEQSRAFSERWRAGWSRRYVRNVAAVTQNLAEREREEQHRLRRFASA